jgi:hypothetical protein
MLSPKLKLFPALEYAFEVAAAGVCRAGEDELAMPEYGELAALPGGRWMMFRRFSNFSKFLWFA